MTLWQHHAFKHGLLSRHSQEAGSWSNRLLDNHEEMEAAMERIQPTPHLLTHFDLRPNEVAPDSPKR